MAKILARQRAVLKTRNEFNVVHNFNPSGITWPSFQLAMVREHRYHRRDIDNQRAYSKLSVRQMNQRRKTKYGYQQRATDDDCARDQKKERTRHLAPTQNQSYRTRYDVSGRRRAGIQEDNCFHHYD
jgi:hypothetical protein